MAKDSVNKKNDSANAGKKKSSVWDVIVNILLVLSFGVLILAVITAMKFKENPEEAFLFGYKPVYILTGSMEPTLREKGICVVKQCGYDDVEVNDIIMYQIEDKTITHRVVEKTEEGIRTKGDNNDVQDAYLLGEENVKAKVVAIFNITAVIINDLHMGAIGYIKWIGFPLMIIAIIIFFPKIVRKIWQAPDEESPKTTGSVENK